MIKNNKNIITICILLNMTLFVSAFAAQKHDNYMFQVLFGKQSYKLYLDSNESKMLQVASYFAIDQYNNNKNKIQILTNNNIKVNLVKINFNSNSTHRQYTHMGWDNIYIKDIANWEKRKKILTDTIRKIFPKKDKEYIISFAALIYYIHILGDNIHDEENKDNGIMTFAGRKDGHDIANELIKHFKILFKNQNKNLNYIHLINMIEQIEKDTVKLKTFTKDGHIRQGDLKKITEEEQKDLNKKKEDLMNGLIIYIPELLKGQRQFRTAFKIKK